MNPRTETLAYRIWGDCRTNGWFRTFDEIAEALNVDPGRIRRVAQLKGWSNRFRATSDSWRDCGHITPMMDAALERLAGNHRYPDAHPFG